MHLAGTSCARETEGHRDKERVGQSTGACTLLTARPGERWERSSGDKRDSSVLEGAVCDPAVGKAPLRTSDEQRTSRKAQRVSQKEREGEKEGEGTTADWLIPKTLKNGGKRGE